jgi:hypothetical protein
MIPLGQWDPARITRLREVLGRVLQYDARVLVPGHGPVLTLDHIRRWLAYLDQLVERVPALARSGKDLTAIEAAVPPPADMADWWRFVEWKHRRNLEMVAKSA